ncbi:uncharacterized protein Z519_07092 [Cladophialophora bantiana CBS 173.52]|uniref:Cytochrome P450 monooxygenase n=1 Tax=Cladophialophora bantiana (strain ATCC 10958 / CBS 173.52 / CDC B-1940 / NIH 8579) TaxID=1442370 RepID=A0A0D2HFS3_CLAB1|nr:uncharacterized protein Z519_07092 [Cladophialophora bantiana CBS 173.52]KIW92108.1 hypothetical protein Z519_07092 [Cladophialophora bantiana CBS 173.52]
MSFFNAVQTWGRELSYETMNEKKVQLFGLAIAIFAVTRFILQAIYNVFLHPIASVPGPWLAKVFGAYMAPAQAGLHRAQTLRSLHDKYGPVVRIGTNEVSISEWTAYRQIYSQKGSNKTHHFYEDTKLAGPGNLFTIINKEAHSGRRKLQNPAYSQQAVLENEDFIANRADVLVRRIMNSHAGNNSSKTVADVFLLDGLFSLEVILKCAFNRHYGDSPAGDSLTLLRAMDSSAVAIQVRAALPFITRSIGKHIPGNIGKSYRGWDVWESMTRTLVEQFQQNEAASDIRQRFMTTPMIVNEDAYLGRKMNQEELVDDMMAVAFAGSGTTSTTLTYLIYSLSRDPKRQDRLRQELQICNETLNDLKDLPFLNAVIKETMRVYPTIMSTLPRVLDEPLTVDKYVLPKGTFVGMQNYVHHRDPRLYPHPDEWWPERWLEDGSNVKDMNAALTPFSLGPYNCIGQNLARAELYLAVSKVFRKLRLTLNADMTDWDMEMEDRFNIAPKGRRCLVDVEVLN